LCIVLFCTKISAQQAFHPVSPLAIPLKLAGTFGELRGNHYHSGIDLKTNGLEGQKVYAIEDGYICRIKISANGFGNVLYINHKQGYTSVYAHLNSFIPAVSQLMDSIQIATEQFESEIFPDSSRFPVKKGEMIGWSGNSGGSEGPHLHFEIRDQQSEEPLNPLRFGFEIADTLAPLITKVLPYYYDGRNWKRFTRIPDNDTIYCNRDTIGLGVYSIDPDSMSKLGIYRADLFFEDSLIYSYSFDRFNFNETKLVNAHIDYAYWYVEKERTHRFHKLMNDNFSIYKSSGSGKIPLPSAGIYNARIIVSDYSGNYTIKNIVIQKAEQDSSETSKNTLTIPYYGDSVLNYKAEGIRIIAEVGSFFQDGELTPISIKKPLKSIQETHPVGFNNPEIAINKPLLYLLPVPSKLKHKNTEKLIYVETDANGQIKNTGRVTINKDSAEVRLRKACIMSLAYDENGPEISNYHLSIDPMNQQTYLRIKAIDKLSGIGNSRILQNGQWIPSYYDPRTAEVIAKMRKEFPAWVSIKITDVCQNAIQIETGF
jgi:hypothetical protein